MCYCRQNWCGKIKGSTCFCQIPLTESSTAAIELQSDPKEALRESQFAFVTLGSLQLSLLALLVEINI